ncbi:MAG: TRAP transporter small permease [Acidobacteria bacterium]|nr:TRAP transporter small permease [Acidobacteriota bacterium]
MRKLVNFIFDIFEVYLAVVIFSALIVSIFLEVFMRYVLNNPSPELFELSIYCFVWVIYLGGALATRYNQHVRFDLIYRALPEKARRVMEIAFDLLTNGVLLVLFYPAIRYTIQMYPIKASALRVPWTFLLLVFPIFLALVLIHNFTTIVKNILRLTGREIKDAEVFPWQ